MSLCDAFSFLCNRNIVLLMSFTLFHNYIKVPESSSVMKGDNLGTGKRRLLVLTDRNIAIITALGVCYFVFFVTVTDLTYSCIYGYSSCKDV